MRYDLFSYWILCEDQQQYNFVVGFLSKKGANLRKIRKAAPFPEGKKGDACDYVSACFNTQRERIRARAAKSILIVICDADPPKQKTGQPAPSEETSIEAFDRLYKRFTVEDDDPIFLMIASRNIETWFYFLQNSEVADSRLEIPDRKTLFKRAEAAPCGQSLAVGLHRIYRKGKHAGLLTENN